MASYDFRCEKCNKEVALECKISEKDEKHPMCCSDKMKQIINPPNVVIKPKDKATYSVEKYYGK